jgi:hypothetical protein
MRKTRIRKRKKKNENIESLSVVLRHVETFESVIARIFPVPSLAQAIDRPKVDFLLQTRSLAFVNMSANCSSSDVPQYISE